MSSRTEPLVRWSPARERPLAPMMWAWSGAALVPMAAYAPFIPGIIALMGLEETQQAAGVATAGWAPGAVALLDTEEHAPLGRGRNRGVRAADAAMKN